MIKLGWFFIALVAVSGAALAKVGMAGSAKRLCADNGFLPPTPEFYECSRSAILVAKPRLHYELTGRFAGGTVTSVAAVGSASIKPPLKGSVNKGLSAYNAGDYETALARWLPKARTGDADAQNNLGLLFEQGLTSQTPKDDDQAAAWYLQAAQQGHVTAMQNLARVQIRQGHPEAAQTWINLSALTLQQRTQQQAIQAQNLGVMGYAVGCAIAGGCGVRPVAPVVTKPVCRLSPYAKDAYGNPKVDCQ